MTFDEAVASVPKLKAIGMRIARQFDQEDIEGIQLAYKAAWELSQMENAHTNPSAFVSVCVQNHFRDLFRYNRRLQSADDLEETRDLGALLTTIWGHATVTDSIGFFESITECLDTETSSIVFDKYVLGMEEPELAKKYNVERGTIKSRLSRANMKMKKSKFCREFYHAMV